MPTLKIDGKEITVAPGTTVIQACDQMGIEIPRFCYHERLEIAGNCRMCLVEVKPGPPKPAASCALPCADNMEVFTDTDMVKRAREGVMEFLLINHPLDCPICDQGGECDLQDQAFAYGRGTSRYEHEKRAVDEKYMGPLIKTHMTRCIHCTRCIRFVEDVAGVPELGAVNRGEHMEVTTYVEKALTTELAGNVVDLCPVGALTSRPYAFVARPWELKKTETIDVMDALGASIRVDSRGRSVLRVLPRVHEGVNEEWISDKTRYAPVDGLKYQRLDKPYIRENGTLRAASWNEAFQAIATALNGLEGSQIAAIAGDMCDTESMLALKELMRSLGSGNTDCRQDGAKLPFANRADYLFNTTIAGIEQADALLLVGSNPRLEAPVLNARIRKAYLKRDLTQIFAIGEPVKLTYPAEWLGNDSQMLLDLIDGKHELAEIFKNAKRPMIILGQGALSRPDGEEIFAAVKKLADALGVVRSDWNGFNVLHTAAARVGGLDIGFVPEEGGQNRDGILRGAAVGDIRFLYLLGADELPMQELGETFVVYQGHTGDTGAHRADVILPGAAFTEKDGTYVNTEGRVQRGWRAVDAPGEAREDWAIIRALSESIGKTLPYNSLPQLRERLEAVNPVFRQIDAIHPAEWKTGPALRTLRFTDAPFAYPIGNFYMTDPISRHSRTMAACTDEVLGRDRQEAA